MITGHEYPLHIIPEIESRKQRRKKHIAFWTGFIGWMWMNRCWSIFDLYFTWHLCYPCSTSHQHFHPIFHQPSTILPIFHQLSAYSMHIFYYLLINPYKTSHLLFHSLTWAWTLMEGGRLQLLEIEWKGMCWLPHILFYELNLGVAPASLSLKWYGHCRQSVSICTFSEKN